MSISNNLSELRYLDISAIACVSESGGIGYKNKLLYNIENDMKHFIDLTIHNAIVMGSKTFESIGKKPLKNRQNIIISNNAESWNKYIQQSGWSDYCVAISNIDYLFDIETPKIFIIGGETIYKLFEPYISKYYLTVVYDDKEYDTCLPFFKDLIGKYKKIERLPRSQYNVKVEHKFDHNKYLKYDFVEIIKYNRIPDELLVY